MSGGKTTAQSREGFVNGISLPYRLAIGWFHYRQGRKAEERKDWKAARRAFRRAARQRPRAPIYFYRLARNYERLEDLPKAVECYRDAIALDDTRAHWHARLATVLALLKHYQAAEHSYRQALALNDRPAEWHAGLAEILERRGLDLTAIAAWRAAIQRKGRVPTYHFRLGCCLERAADRSGFMRALDPQSLADLGREGPAWIAELAQSERISGAAFWQEAKVAYNRALEGKGNKTEVWFRLGRLLEKQEDWKGAADAYAHALHKTLDKVRWLYRYQYCASLAGLSSDSTFKVTFTPNERVGPARISNPQLASPEKATTPEVSLTLPAAGAVIGYWHAIPAPARFEIRGNLFSDVTTVYLFVDDRMVKAINVEDASADGHIHKTFHFSMKKRLLQSFPSPARIAIAADTGRLVHFSGANELLIEVTGAKNSLFKKLDAGSYISKKGTLVARKRSPAGLQKRLLAAYETLRDEFDKRFDRPLFLLFGTLLGKVRDGGLLPGDDDFDVGYVSAGSTPEEVKAEALGFIETLVKAGYN